MGMVVNHNISAINTLRNLDYSNRAMSKSLQKLSSGYRINSGQDGPADLIISEQLRAQTVGLQRAVRNTQEATNVLGIAEGALNEMNAILKTMRQLALHAANNGITSPDQVAADQAEVDSSIQTIDRIANTTKYSDQMLLNGNKSLLYDRVTQEGNQLINSTYTRIDQVFKRKGITETFAYSGDTVNSDAADMTVQATRGFFEAGATADSRDEINREQNTLKTDQAFILTGAQGSREFSFAEGTSLSSIASSINNVADSTGVRAQTTLAAAGVTLRTGNVAGDDDMVSNDAGNDTADTGDDLMANANGVQNMLIFGQTSDADRITDITWDSDVILGKHTDGHGRIYVDASGTLGGETTVKLYKADKQADGTYREEDLVAEGVVDTTAGGASTVVLGERNNSGLSGTMDVNDDGFAGLDEEVVLVGHSIDRQSAARDAQLQFAMGDGDGLVFEVDSTTATGTADLAGFAGNQVSIAFVDPGAADQDLAVTVDGYNITVSLGTDENGDLDDTKNTDTLIEALVNGDAQASKLVNATALGGAATDQGATARSRVYLSGGLDANEAIEIDSQAEVYDHVAINGLELGENTDADGKLYVRVDDQNGTTAGVQSIKVYKDLTMSADSLVAEWDSGAATGLDAADDVVYLDEANDSGLRIALQVDGASITGGDSTWTMQQGMRLYADNYGASDYVRVQQLQGQVFDYYDVEHADANTFGYVNLDSTNGSVTAESRGTGGVVSVNGQELFTDGLSAEAATADFNGHIVFREGELAQTTIAQVGYDRSASSTAIGQMMLVNNLAVNAGTNNREDITNFTNGMQFQLGEGDGDQERTVYSIQSMAVANLGKVKFTDDFNGDGQQTEKTLTLSDLLGGGFGSLAVDPVKALTVIDAAINDVSGLRARIGSFQANMLQTNANSLGVAIENITATESDIRDANMAAETTDFTKNQILVQAGTAMLAQANATSQNVLQLLG